MDKDQKNQLDTPIALFVGLDWADEKHALSFRAPDSKDIERLTLEQTPEALEDWVNTMSARFSNGKIAICVEQARGALISALLKYPQIVLYPVNPKCLASFRVAFYPSRTKNDTTDADLLLEYLYKHPEKLRPWKPDTEQTRLLALLTEQRRHFVDQRTELTNELSAHLKAIFPQALELVGTNLGSPLCTHFLKKWPTLQQLRQAKPSKIRNFYYGHNVRSDELIDTRLALIKNAVPLTTDGALLKSHALAIQTLVALLDGLGPSLQKHDEQIAELFASHPDSHLFANLPGAGAAMAPRLLACLGTDRGRFSSAEELSCYTGIAPVTEQSGKTQRWVHVRYSCPKFLRQTWHEFAAQSIRFSPWAHAAYTEYRKKMLHHQAVRKLAYKWQRIIWRIWQNRTPYDEARYLRDLQKRGIQIYQNLSPEPLQKR